MKKATTEKFQKHLKGASFEINLSLKMFSSIPHGQKYNRTICSNSSHLKDIF